MMAFRILENDEPPISGSFGFVLVCGWPQQ